MTDPSIGHVVDVQPKSRSRREVTVTTGLVGLQRMTLMPGVLGTPDGDEMIARAADLRTVVYTPTRRRAARVRPTPDGG